MPPTNLSEHQLRELAYLVAAYISEQRVAFFPRAVSLLPEQRKPLQPFFPSDVLDGVRVARGRVSEPSFYSGLRAMGIRNAPAFSQMAGITFQDVIVHVEPLTESLLFHELVHAVQYKHLGLQGFAERYVRGFLTGGSYEEIPLEKQAYELEGKFIAHPAETFSVEEDVGSRLRSNQL